MQMLWLFFSPTEKDLNRIETFFISTVRPWQWTWSRSITLQRAVKKNCTEIIQKWNVAVREEQLTNTSTRQDLQTTPTENFRAAGKELKAKALQAYL